MTKSNYKKKVVDSFQVWIPKEYRGSHFAREVPNRNGCTMAEVHHDMTPGRSSGWFMFMDLQSKHHQGSSGIPKTTENSWEIVILSLTLILILEVLIKISSRVGFSTSQECPSCDRSQSKQTIARFRILRNFLA